MSLSLFLIVLSGIGFWPDLDRSAHAHEGSSVHGGSSVVCRDEGGAIVQAWLTDLYEAKADGVRLQPDETPEEMILRQAIRNATLAEPGFGYRLEKMVAEIRTMFLFQPKGTRLPFVDDLGGASILPENCTYEQLGLFHDGMLLIDTDLYSHLSPLNRVAFLIHEGVYTIERSERFGTTDSSRARQITRQLLALEFSAAELGVSIRGMTIKPRGGLYRTASEKLSFGCELAIGFYDEYRSKIEVQWRQDPRVPDVACSKLGLRRALPLDPRSGSYGDRDDGIVVDFLGERNVAVYDRVMGGHVTYFFVK